MQFRRPSRARVAIDIAPLVDVVFLLVIFFAVSTTFLETSGLKLELPKSTSTARRDAQDLTVYLAADGELTFDGVTLERALLAERLGSALGASERKRVVLQADANARHGEVVTLMDLIRDAGAESLTVAARPGEP